MVLFYKVTVEGEALQYTVHGNACGSTLLTVIEQLICIENVYMLHAMDDVCVDVLCLELILARRPQTSCVRA